MTQPIDTYLPAWLEQLADIRLRQATLKAAGDDLSAKIRQALASQEEQTFGRLRVTCKQPKRFSPELAATLLAPEILKSITETTEQVSEKLAKKHLSGDAFESCREPFGERKIIITRIA